MKPQDTTQPPADTLEHEIGATETVSEAVIRAVATATGHDPVPKREAPRTPSLDPLYTVVDPDALDRVGDSIAGSSLVVEFTYEGYQVTVDSTSVRLTRV